MSAAIVLRMPLAGSNTQVDQTAARAIYSMGIRRATPAIVLPNVWAMEAQPAEMALMRHQPRRAILAQPAATPAKTNPVALELAFYRKYTEALLRRYVKMSMEAGRAPSMLGREMFRGKVTSYRVHSFEDVVIFVYDVEKCLGKLDLGQQQILYRVAQQEYTFQEAAALLAIPLRTVVRRYGRALDALTERLLESRLLEPLKACQGG